MLKMGMSIVAFCAFALFALGCSTQLGGENPDNKTGTYANNVQVKNMNSITNPAPENNQ